MRLLTRSANYGGADSDDDYLSMRSAYDSFEPDLDDLEDLRVQMDDPELNSFTERARVKILCQERALRSILVGNGLHIHGKGFDDNSPLGTVIGAFKSWLHMPDIAAIEASYGTLAAHMLPGSPAWLMLVGQASSGKSEIIQAARDVKGTISVSTVTPASLLSATPRKERTGDSTGGIMGQIDPTGILLMKDFTSILQMDPNERNKALAALREIFDGEWVRPAGSDGGRILRWPSNCNNRGKCSVLGGCTPAIDSYNSLMVAMGERFLYCRMPLVNGYAQSQKALDNASFHDTMQETLRMVVKELFLSVTVPRHLPTLEGDEMMRMVALANLITVCRQAVERDSYGKREILKVHEPEAPARVSKELNQILQGMLTIGVYREEAWRVAGKIAIDSMPSNRIMVLHALSSSPGYSWEAQELADHLRYPFTPIHRTLEDMEAIHFLNRVKDGRSWKWSLSGGAVTEYKRAFPPRIEF